MPAPLRRCLDCGRLAPRTRCRPCERNRDTEYDAQWRALAARVLDRDDHHCRCPGCQACMHDYVVTTCIRTATTVDHIIPLKRGGTRAPQNLRAMCRQCNSSKRDR